MLFRLLIVDGSHLTAWLVAQVAPPGVEIVRAETFASALRILDEAPPDAAIFNLTPCRLEWQALVDRCNRHEPRIPFLCTSALDGSEDESLPIPCSPDDYCPKSLLVHDLRARVERLVERSTETRAGLRSPA